MKKVFVIDSSKGHRIPWAMALSPLPGVAAVPVLKDGKTVLSEEECQKIKRSCEAVALKGLTLMHSYAAITPIEEEGEGVVLRVIDPAIPGGKAEF